MPRQLPQPGFRVSLRRVRPDGEQGDLIGFVLSVSELQLRLRDRRGKVHEVTWQQVLAWRSIGVARGRDPRRTPLAELDALATAAGASGSAYVARVAELVEDLAPPVAAEPGGPPPQPAVLSGEWVTTGSATDLPGLAWWAAHNDARSLQVRTTDPDIAARLLAAGFTERTAAAG